MIRSVTDVFMVAMFFLAIAVISSYMQDSAKFGLWQEQQGTVRKCEQLVAEREALEAKFSQMDEYARTLK